MNTPVKFAMTCALFLTAVAAMAENTCPSMQFSNDHEAEGKSGGAVLVVDHAQVVSKDGAMGAMGELLAYQAVHDSANGGTYIVFRAQDGSLHRLDSSAVVDSLKESCAPDVALRARMHDLHEQQKPLDAQMHELSAQMKQAQSTEDRAAIGRRMGELGESMGAIGRQQGDVGRQEGELARAFHEKLKTLIDACLRQGTCPVVSKS